MTDSNGFEMVNRAVHTSDSGPFSSSFYPVDASISVKNKGMDSALTIWNDRPQAGSVHAENKSILLLVDRQLKTRDLGGIDKVPHPYRPADRFLNLHFKLQFQKMEE